MARSRQYTLDEKQAVALTFAIKGSVRATAKASGVPFETVRNWTHQDWFDEMLTRVRSEKDQEWDSKLSALIDKLLDRLQEKYGEISLDKLPVSLAVLYDKLRLHRNQPTSIRRTETAHERIKKLHETYTALAQKDDLGKVKTH